MYLPSNGFFCATRSQKTHEIIRKLLKTGLRHSTRTKLCSKKNPKHLSFTVGQKKVRKDFLSSSNCWDGVIEHTIILLNILILPCLSNISRLAHLAVKFWS